MHTLGTVTIITGAVKASRVWHDATDSGMIVAERDKPSIFTPLSTRGEFS